MNYNPDTGKDYFPTKYIPLVIASYEYRGNDVVFWNIFLCINA